MKKCFTVGIILLLLTIGFTPILNANINATTQTKEDVPITILVYKGDGTAERTDFLMSAEQADNFREEMENAQDLETRLSIYKKYNLISDEITVDWLQQGMQERAQTMGLTQNGLMSLFGENQSLLLPFVRRNLFCYARGHSIGWHGRSFPPVILLKEVRYIGLSFYITGLDRFETIGLLGYSHFEPCIFVKLVGFVGVLRAIQLRERHIDFEGFCVFTKAFGFPVYIYWFLNRLIDRWFR